MDRNKFTTMKAYNWKNTKDWWIPITYKKDSARIYIANILKAVKLTNMYIYKKARKTSLSVNTSYIGERIEQKVARILNNKEPITDGAPLVYTERKDGVKPEYDIRTDRWEIANEAMNAVNKSHLAAREERIKLGEEAKKGMEKEGKTQSTHGTSPDTGESK